MENAWLDELSGKTSDFSDAVIPDYSGGDTLNIGTGETVSYVNPFYPGNAGETAASDLVSVKLFDTDREGSVSASPKGTVSTAPTFSATWNTATRYISPATK